MSYASPRWTYEFLDCSMPMAFDQYSNCGYSCVYCFSQYQRGIGKRKKAYYLKGVDAVDVGRVKRMFAEPSSSQFGRYIEKGLTMQWGSLSDPFCPLEQRYQVGLELMKFFHEIRYPLSFSTKATWWLDDPRYTELFQGMPWHVKFSIITLDKEKSSLIERGTPTPEARLQAMEKASKLGIPTTLRLRPFIIGVSDPTYPELIKRAAEAGAQSMSTEFFCAEERSPMARRQLKTIGLIAGFDVHAFYKKHSYQPGYLRLNRAVKKQFVDYMEEHCKQNGLRFYVSDAHFKERCHHGSCCGLPLNMPYNKGQFCEALVHCRKGGRADWRWIEQHLDFAKGLSARNNFNMWKTERASTFWYHDIPEFLRFMWNHPKCGNSPYRMYEGAMRPSGKDKDGNLVYAIDKSKL